MDKKGTGQVQCNIQGCRRTLNIQHSNTSSMRKHLKAKHNIVPGQKKQNNDEEVTIKKWVGTNDVSIFFLLIES
jgi:hypothetical protein